MSDQPGQNPPGTPEKRWEEEELSKNMSKFADIAKSVGEMESTIENLQKDMTEIKRNKSAKLSQDTPVRRFWTPCSMLESVLKT
ncbi:hypothetical protein DPMN_115131 [Dreissena polymorpha]|uniref:Uncharacterized protein n=1 Tax=Dreissena polymorpha TaxID=45954 RepID=A0A9D4KKQ3_DREPO|nr:hypothetical protein DPMN_115131 [Dreissena polymorpha]